MSSASFLITWILSLKRKTHLRRLGTEMIKRLRLDSLAVKEDLIIITWYHECTTALMSNNCKQIHVFISFKNKIERIYVPWSMRPSMVDLPWETAPLHGFPHPEQLRRMRKCIMPPRWYVSIPIFTRCAVRKALCMLDFEYYYPYI